MVNCALELATVLGTLAQKCTTPVAGILGYPSRLSRRAENSPLYC